MQECTCELYSWRCCLFGGFRLSCPSLPPKLRWLQTPEDTQYTVANDGRNVLDTIPSAALD